MDDLITFLRARLDEIEGPVADARRGLFEIAYLEYIDDQTDETAQQMLRLLGLFDDGHPEYLEEWRPFEDD